MRRGKRYQESAKLVDSKKLYSAKTAAIYLAGYTN